MGSAHNRPTPFPPGTRLSDRYTVEGLVRLSEGRMFYLANDDRPDRATRFCWECKDDATPRDAHHCSQCGAEMLSRRFLISVRWQNTSFEPLQRFQARELSHPGIVPILDIFLLDGVQCAVTAWTGDALLLDEGSPLSREDLSQLALRGTGLTAFLLHNGIEVAPLTLANFVRDKEGAFKLYDLDITSVSDTKINGQQSSTAISGLASLLRQFTAVHETELNQLFEDAEAGKYTTPMNFGRALVQGFQNGAVSSSTDGNCVVAAMSDVGLLRVLNEDNWGWAQLSHDIGLYVAADGMGGHDCGEIASLMAVQTIAKVAKERLKHAHTRSVESLENVLDEAFQAANNTIKAHSEDMGNDMGTTLTAAAVYRNQVALVANVGDSRAYLMREQVLHQITSDHSLVARMVEQNRLTPEEARSHPHSNILLRTVGTERNVEIDIFSVELEKGDRLVLCTDGLWGEIKDEDIEALLNQYADPKVVCREMIRAAHHGGGRDNITVVIVQVP